MLGDEKAPITLAEFEQKVTEGGKEMTVVLYSDKEAAFKTSWVLWMC
jgi:biopolymer transport protein ExbD